MPRSALYLEDVRRVAGLPLPWDRLRGKSVLVTGASGLIGSCLVDVLMCRNRDYGLGCKVAALGRDEARARERFGGYWDDPSFRFTAHDVNTPLPGTAGRADFVLHLASNTHPNAYATDPIGTITANVLGLKHLLDLAAGQGAERFLFASSVEVYGSNRGDVELFDEGYCGYIDLSSVRSGYPEAKRCGEALCLAYRSQRGLDAVIPRFPRTYGPTMLPSDSKAIAQFIRRGAAGEDIVLKSAGTQCYSYAYAADAVSGLLTVLLKGEGGAAYNVVGEDADITLKDLAGFIARRCGTGVSFEAPDEVERSGYSHADKARMSGGKLMALGWRARYGVREGVARTLEILRE